MAIGDAINPVGELAQITGESVANPLPVDTRQYMLADTIGKLKACGVKWEIKIRNLNLAAATPTEILPVNEARVYLAVLVAISTQRLHCEGMDQTGPGFDITASAAPQEFNYDTHGPLVGKQWFLTLDFGGPATVIEITARQ